MARYFESTLERNIEKTVLVEVNKGSFVLREYKHTQTILEKKPNGEYVEDLGFFHQLSKALHLPYQKCYDIYVERFEQLLKEHK